MIVLDGYWGLLEDATHLIIFIGLKKLKLPIVAPSRVRSSPHNLSATPLPTQLRREGQECGDQYREYQHASIQAG